MAIFTGVASKARAEKILARMAKGNCTGPGKRATWVSEKPFYSCKITSILSLLVMYGSTLTDCLWF